MRIPLPRSLKDSLKKRLNEYNSFKSNLSHNKKVSELKSKLVNNKKIKIVFLVIHQSIWKYEELYRLFHLDDRFIVKVAIIPHVKEGKVNFDTYYNCRTYFIQNNYDIVDTYDEKTHTWHNLNSSFNSDIVFFTNPHKLTFDQYYINAFRNQLTCYVPYAFVVIKNIDMHYNQPIFSKLWRYFLETEEHLNFATKYLTNKYGTLRVTGYPSLDRIYKPNYKPKKVWKTTSEEVTKIIWAPHHTIKGQGENLDYSSFLKYSKYFLHLIENRRDLHFVFKPHPLLKDKLYAEKTWGKLKTDQYFEKWSSYRNSQIELGEYIDLFQESDAMIMDSASFLAEYLYFNKPLLFTKNDDDVQNRFNSFGRKILDVMYEAYNQSEIEDFINNLTFQKNDPKKSKREDFFKNQIIGAKTKTASENIYQEILKELI